jgi:hypothetical protein
MWDSTNNYVRLSQSGTPTNSSELDSSWTPEWSSLVAYWNFNGTIGSLASGVSISATVGPTGTTSNANGTGMAYAQGQLNQGISFDGVDDYISAARIAALNPTGQISAAAWIKTTSSQEQYIVTQNNDSYYFATGINGDGTACIFMNNVSAGWLCSLTAVNDNNWHHVVASYDGTTISIYVDGLLSNSTNRTGTVPSGSSITYIGIRPSFSGNGKTFIGMIDELALWSIGLKASEVQTIYSRQSAKYAGTFTSRVMDGLASQLWTNFSWTPTLPFYKELPDANASNIVQNESSSSYSSLKGDTPTVGDNNLMTGIIGLWHLDEAAGTSIAYDRSGQGNNGSVQGGTTFARVGKLGTAVSLNGTSGFIKIPFSASLDTNPTVVSVSAWIKSLSTTGGTGNIIFTAGDGGAHTYQLYLNSGKADLFSNNVDLGGTTLVSDGNWHHLVGTWNGSTASLYVDGVFNKSAAMTFGGIVIDNQIGVQCSTAGSTGCNGYFNGSIDEVAVWNKVLNSAEVLQLYRRGANRIRYQVRSCPDSACGSGPAWLGPDGTNQTYFSELNNNFIQNDGADLTLSDIVQTNLPKMTFSNFGSLMIPTNRYFQYRAIMESDDTSTGCNYSGTPTWCSPELQSVTVGP